MILRDGVLSSRIIRRPLDRTNPALTSDTALQLGANFISGSFLERIGASRHEQKNRGR